MVRGDFDGGEDKVFVRVMGWGDDDDGAIEGFDGGLRSEDEGEAWVAGGKWRVEGGGRAWCLCELRVNEWWWEWERFCERESLFISFSFFVVSYEEGERRWSLLVVGELVECEWIQRMISGEFEFILLFIFFVFSVKGIQCIIYTQLLLQILKTN